MRYVALLRAINVGGKSKVEMSRLKEAFTDLKFDNVTTYINSGNVLFDAKGSDRGRLVKRIEGSIEDEFGFLIPVLLRTRSEIARILKSAPPAWVTDKRMRCDVMFLQTKFYSGAVLKQVPVQPEIVDLRYVSGALIWRIDRAKAGRSKVGKIIGTELYKNLTIRNINTVRKLADLLKPAR
jgi:uncharacterized protein (DUF1697 family)